MKTIIITLIIIVVLGLTKWLMLWKNEQIIKSFLHISDDNVTDFECGYGKNKSTQ